MDRLVERSDYELVTHQRRFLASSCMILKRLGIAVSLFGAYSAVAVVATWPLARDCTTRIAGGGIDAWQTLWGLWWWRHSLSFGDWPFHTSLLWWPTGVSLWLQTWDIPSAVAMMPLWGLIPAELIYNIPIFLSFPLSGLAFYALCRELWPGRLAAFLAGALYTFSSYHYANAQTNLHIASMQWAPLFFLGLVQCIRGRSAFGPVFAGLGFALATLTSLYHSVSCIVGGCLLLIFLMLQQRASVRQWYSAGGRLLVAAAVGGCLVGWYIVGIVGALRSSKYFGAHSPILDSADMQSLFVPGTVNYWGSHLSVVYQWFGGEWSTGMYIGYAVTALAAYGAIRRPEARSFLAVGICGIALAIGPVAHYAGRGYPGILLPYGWLATVTPLELGGMPSRFMWLGLFGVCAAAGAGLSDIVSRAKRRRGGLVLAMLATFVCLSETWPSPFRMAGWARPAIFSEWATDGANWAVLDATDFGRALWHQTLHHHPIVAGYVTRTPVGQWLNLKANSPLRRWFRPPIGNGSDLSSPVDNAVVGKALSDLGIRFVVVDSYSQSLAYGAHFAERYRDGELTIYEVR